MSKIFYDHLIIREEITAQLDLHKLDPEEREELLQLVDETLHHTTLNVILNHLPKEHHSEFMTKFHSAPYDESLLDYLQQRIPSDIRSEITAQAAKVKKEILTEIKKSRHK
jgi:hypothetical protein